MLDRSVTIFFDDIVVYSKTQEQHEYHLRGMSETLRSKRLYVMLSKCEFWLHEVQFLGQHVNKNGIMVDLGKVEAMMKWEVLRSPSDI